MMDATVSVRSDIGISQDDREAVGRILNTLLASEYVLYTKMRKYHWNVVGPRFSMLHELFEDQYKELSEMIDGLAERVRQLSVQSIGTLQEFMEQSKVSESPGQYPDSQTMISNLMEDQDAVIREIRVNNDIIKDQHNDAATSNFLEDALHRHEKMSWMLRAHLVGEESSRP